MKDKTTIAILALFPEGQVFINFIWAGQDLSVLSFWVFIAALIALIRGIVHLTTDKTVFSRKCGSGHAKKAFLIFIIMLMHLKSWPGPDIPVPVPELNTVP